MKQLIMAVMFATLVTLPCNIFTAEIKSIHKHCKTCKCNKQIKKPSWLIKNKNTVIACVVCAGLISGFAYVFRGKKALAGKQNVKITPQPQIDASAEGGTWNYVANLSPVVWVTGWWSTNTAKS